MDSTPTVPSPSTPLFARSLLPRFRSLHRACITAWVFPGRLHCSGFCPFCFFRCLFCFISTVRGFEGDQNLPQPGEEMRLLIGLREVLVQDFDHTIYASKRYCILHGRTKSDVKRRQLSFRRHIYPRSRHVLSHGNIKSPLIVRSRQCFTMCHPSTYKLARGYQSAILLGTSTLS
jgi:hypothetical protein